MSHFQMRLPRNGKEFILFLGIVSILSVNLIGPIVVGFQLGFSMDTWMSTLKILPFIWVVVVCLVLVFHPLAEKLSNKILDEKDSFNAQMIVTTLLTVVFISFFMTVIGPWIGQGQFSMSFLTHFFANWPRNFAVAFAVEALIAQPIAREIMYRLHLKQDKVNA